MEKNNSSRSDAELEEEVVVVVDGRMGLTETTSPTLRREVGVCRRPTSEGVDRWEVREGLLDRL